jgi:hypothetical protein
MNCTTTYNGMINDARSGIRKEMMDEHFRKITSRTPTMNVNPFLFKCNINKDIDKSDKKDG